MRLFLPSFDAASTERALTEAHRIMRPGDHLIVMVPIIVPKHLPVDVSAGAIWTPVCQAEWRLFHARAAAERLLPRTVTLHFVRVQARDVVAAIRTGAAHYHADCLLLDLPNGFFGAFSLRFATIAALLRNAPCHVRFVGTTGLEEAMQPRESVSLALLPTLEIVAVNPALSRSRAEDRARQTEGQHAP